MLISLLNSDAIKDILLIDKPYSDDLWYGNDNDSGIVYKQIFPYLHIDDTQMNEKTYICFEVNIANIPTAAIKNMDIVVWCLCHKSCMKYDKEGYSGTRADILSDAVEQALRQSEMNSQTKEKTNFGIGKLQLQSVTQFTPANKDFYGRQMSFTVPDFRFKN